MPTSRPLAAWSAWSPTTASTHDPTAAPGARRLPLALAVLIGALWAWTGIAPADRGTWLLESALPLSALALLGGMYRQWHLSDLSYLAIAVFLALHLVGARHGYAEVPLGTWMRDAFHALGWEAATRNPYDRLVHLGFGVLIVYPLRELLQHHTRSPRAAALFALAAVLALSAVYEVLEWGAGRLLAPEAAAGFVGAQGDAWDAQQDMALAGVGSVVTLGMRALCVARGPRPTVTLRLRTRRTSSRREAVPVLVPVSGARRAGARSTHARRSASGPDAGASARAS